MPLVKKEQIGVKQATGWQYLNIDMMVGRDGKFYCYPPEDLIPLLSPKIKQSNNSLSWEINHKGKWKFIGLKYNDIYIALKEAFEVYTTPQIVETPVIRYLVGSFAHFGIDKDGNINQHGMTYHHLMKEMYSPHGYFLNISIKAYMKTVHTYGEVEKNTYIPLDQHPEFITNDYVKKLNDWQGMTFPERQKESKEIPYSDQSADFLYHLIYGLVSLINKMNEKIAEPEKLLPFIQSLSGLKQLEDFSFLEKGKQNG